MLIKTKSFTLATYSKGDETSKNFALVLPGKLDTKDYAHMKNHVEHLANLGFFALSLDPPGTWESGDNISDYTTTNYIKAINELIQYFDNKETFLMGHSRGGSMAMLVGTTNINVKSFAAVMSYSYVNNYKDAKEEVWKKAGFITTSRDLPPGGGEKVKEFKLPFSFLEDQKQYTTDDKLKVSEKPKLFILGKHDVMVPPEKVKQAFESAAEPKELYELDSGHDYRHYPKLIEEVNKVVEDFLKKYNLIQNV